MGLFYPSMFGIVGQKMTSLQYRSQGDPEDPHDEHYLMATQSKQDQVTHIIDHPPVYTVIIVRFFKLKLFWFLSILTILYVSTSPPNQLQSAKLFPDQVEVWMER